MQSSSRLIKFITALGFALTVAGLCLLIFPLVHKSASVQEAQKVITYMIYSSFAILPLGISLFGGGLLTLIVRKKNENKNKS